MSDGFWYGVIGALITLIVVVLLYIAYDIGRQSGRQAVEAVACEAKQDSVIVHPVRQPRGRVQ